MSKSYHRWQHLTADVLTNCIIIRWAGVKKSLSDFGVTSAVGGDSKAADDDDDVDLFGDDDEVTTLVLT